MATVGEPSEIAAIRQNMEMISAHVRRNPRWFANKLVEKAFVTQDEASNILDTDGIGPVKQAAKLLDSVVTVLKYTDKRKAWFDEFIDIFSPEAAYVELVEKLKKCHESLNSDTTRAAVQIDNPGKCAVF